MVSRLRKEINRQNHEKFLGTCKKKSNNDLLYKEPEHSRKGHSLLPLPQKLLQAAQQHKHYGPFNNMPKGTGSVIKSSTEIRNRHNEWRMMRDHCLWVRVFDIHDRFLFNHANPQSMSTSQMIHLCTKLINHLNLISRTNELKAQDALGTLEETIISQLTPPPEGQMQYHSWNLQEQESIDPIHDVEAIAIIRQTRDNIFEGQLIDDMIGTTFHIE